MNQCAPEGRDVGGPIDGWVVRGAPLAVAVAAPVRRRPGARRGAVPQRCAPPFGARRNAAQILTDEEGATLRPLFTLRATGTCVAVRRPRPVYARLRRLGEPDRADEHKTKGTECWTADGTSHPIPVGHRCACMAGRLPRVATVGGMRHIGSCRRIGSIRFHKQLHANSTIGAMPRSSAFLDRQTLIVGMTKM